MSYHQIYELENAHDDAIWTVAWGKNNETGFEYIITGSLDDTAKAWGWEDNQLDLKYSFEGHSLGVVSVDISSNGSVAATNSLDSHIRLWDLNTSQPELTVDAGPVDAWTVKFSPDSTFIATCTQTGKIALYKTTREDGSEIKPFKELDSTGKYTMASAIRPDSGQIAGGAIDGMIKLYDIETGRITNTLDGHAMPVRSLCYSPDGKFLISASDDCHLKLYEVHSGEIVKNLSGHGSWVLGCDFSPDNVHFCSGSSDKTVKIWNINSSECEQTLSHHKEQVWDVKYNHDGSQLVSVSEDKTINVYGLA